MSNMETESYPVAASGGKIAPSGIDAETSRPPSGATVEISGAIARRPFAAPQPLGRFFGSYGQRSTTTQTPHKGLRAMQT